MIVLNYLINGIRMDFSFFLLGNRPAERSNFEAFSLSYNTIVCVVQIKIQIFLQARAHQKAFYSSPALVSLEILGVRLENSLGRF